MKVTDIKAKDRFGKPTTGFYMDGYLKENLDGIPKFLAKKWDVMGIISGRTAVGSGKSTMGLQIGYYLTWLMAGGRMVTEQIGGKVKVKKIIKPKRPVRFGMENIVFTPEDLEKKAISLFNKYGAGQVILYDEGRTGLDSAGVMTIANRAMAEFMQRCRVYNHIMLIVLPDFFKLHEDYAVSRSLFLIDVFTDNQHNRGFFSFFNKLQKEKLFHFGKRRIGQTAKYLAASHNFWGRFTKWMPVDDVEYDNAKMKAMKNLSLGNSYDKFMKQRDVSIYLLQKFTDMTSKEISKEICRLCNFKLGERGVRHSISKVTKQKEDEIE